MTGARPKACPFAWPVYARRQRKAQLTPPRDGTRRAGGCGQAVCTIRCTLTMVKTVPVREFRNHLSALLSDVADRRDHVLVTRNGKPAAALVPIDE
jgi:prevent-host-death family protein